MSVGGTCGLWPGGRGLAAAIIDTRGRVRSVQLPRTDDAREGLVAYLVAAGVAELVLPEPVVRSYEVGRIAAENGISVWVVPSVLVTPLCRAAGIPASRSKPSAALLARLPGIPAFRAQMRRLSVPGTDRQLRLI